MYSLGASRSFLIYILLFTDQKKKKKIALGCISTSFVNSNDQLADIFTKSLRGPRIKYICDKLGAFDLYAPA